MVSGLTSAKRVWSQRSGSSMATTHDWETYAFGSAAVGDGRELSPYSR